MAMTGNQRHQIAQRKRAQEQKQKEQQRKRDEHASLTDVLQGLGLGLGGEFHQLIDRAVRNNFTAGHFEEAVKNSKSFRRKFPGLIQDGEIAQFISSGSGDTTLATAVKAYNDFVNSYEQNLRGTGQKLTPQMITALIDNQVSPEELGTRATAVKSVESNPGLLQNFNEQLKVAGHKPIDQQDLYRFAAGAFSGTFYDVYEAAWLRSQGLNMNAQEAAQTAAGIGTSKQMAQNLPELVAFVRSTNVDVGPELQRAGITDADLTLLKAGQDPKNQGTTLAQIVGQRRALQQRSGTRQGAVLGEEQKTLD